MFGNVKYTYVAWHMCNFCSRSYKDIDKLLDHKFENHHDEFMGINSAARDAGDSKQPRKKPGPREKRVATETSGIKEKDEYSSSSSKSSKLGKAANKEASTIKKIAKPEVLVESFRKAGVDNHEQYCKKKKPKVCLSSSEDENEDTDARQKSPEPKQNQDDLYHCCSHCSATFSSMEALRRHGNCLHQKPQKAAVLLDDSDDDDDDGSSSQSSGDSDSSEEPSPEPRELDKKPVAKKEGRSGTGLSPLQYKRVRRLPTTFYDPMKIGLPIEQRSGTTMASNEVSSAEELSPRAVRMSATVEPRRTIRCVYCWEKFDDHGYGEHRKICSKRLRTSFTARKSISNTDLAATVEHLTQQVGTDRGKRVEKESKRSKN